ncbi:MAG: hypothetical protein ACR2G6_10265 [Gemmatimonadaceae bacterium]
MFRAILFTQWKWTRAMMLPLVIVAFAVPLYSVNEFSDAAQSRAEVAPLLSKMQAWGFGYMMAAMFVGLFVAAMVWSYDTKGKHVYALSLPLPRWHYLLLRFAAGALMLLLPALFLWVGALVATSSAHIPVGLHAYPTALALRFLLATFLVYSLVFAMSAVPKKIGIVLVIAMAGVVLLDAALSQAMGRSVIVTNVFEWAVRWPGYFEVFAGRWMLIDV